MSISIRLILITSIVLLVGSFVLAQDEALPRVELVDECFIEVADIGYEYECGYLVVPEFHGTDNGRTVKIAFVRHFSSAEEPGVPLFKTHGGPGGSELAFLTSAQHEGLLTPILENHDIVQFNQRGSRYSEPWLTCTDENAAAQEQVLLEGLRDEERRAVLNDAIQACHDRLISEGVDFTAFNSLENAADVNALREALGYDKIIYHGTSYGTMLGQHVMRDYPQILDGVVLDGSVSLAQQDSWVEENAIKSAEIWKKLFTTCAEDEACSETFPTFEADLEAAIARFDAEPYLYSVGGQEVAIDGLRLFNALQNWSVQIPEFKSPQVPLFVQHLANNDDTSILDTIFGQLFPEAEILAFGDGDLAVFAHYAITCSEDPVSGTDDVNTDGTPSYSNLYGIDDAEQYVLACDLLDVPALPDVDRANVSTSIPILFMNGPFDNATPPSWNHALADVYEQAYVAEIPLGQHGQVFKPFLAPCPSVILTQFVDDPTTAPDMSCIAAMAQEIPWYIPGAPEE